MERLQQLEKEVAAQETKLKSLHLRHQQQQCQHSFDSGSSRREETMSSLIFLKEKELAHALMKVAELTGQLEHLKKTEVKSEANSRTKGKNTSASSIVRTLVPTPAVRFTSESCQTKAEINQESNGSSKVVVYHPSGAEMMKSRSFDASSSSQRGRSFSRDQFFSTSNSGTVSCSFPAASGLHNGQNPRASLKSEPSNFGKDDPSCEAVEIRSSKNDRDIPINSRPSTSSSIMSRFAPKPYSSRSMSVDCGSARRPLLQIDREEVQEDSKETGTDSNSCSTSKALSSCLLPKSASFHYGHSQHETGFVKLKRLDPRGGNVVSQEIIMSLDPLEKTKPRLTPKPVQAIKDFDAPVAVAMDCPPKQDDVQSCPEFEPTPEPPKRRSKIIARKPFGSTNSDSPLKEGGDNLTTTFPCDSNCHNANQVFECGQKGSDLSEVFKKGGVRELSKLFSLSQNDPGKKEEASKNAPVSTEEPETARVDASSSSSTCLPSNETSEERREGNEAKETTSSTNSGSEIDTSATAVSSALSILLSGSSNVRQRSACRPNRLFGYSSSFSRPKFSFVPSETSKEDSSGTDRDADRDHRVQSSSLHGNQPNAKAPTIYSLFSPPPKAKLSSGSPEKYSKSADRSVSYQTEMKSSSKKAVCLPRLSYITLSSDLTRQGSEEVEPLTKKIKSKKKVTIDPSFLFLSAAVEGELDIIKSIIHQVGNPDVLCNDNGMTALHMAVCNGHVEVVKFLLDYGCNVNASNYESWTPLHFAALGNKKEIAESLVGSGACVFALTSSDRETPVQKCQSKLPQYEECSKVLEDFGNQLGHSNGGIVFSAADYEAESADECSLRDGEMIRILRRGDEVEAEWWWACKTCGRITTEGYAPRSILSLHPRRPKLWKRK